MDKNVKKYEGLEKSYFVKKRKNKTNHQNIFILIFITAILTLLVGCICLKVSLENKNTKIGINYVENGKSDYQVLLKPNNYYEDTTLNSGMKYVADLIDKINVNFSYDIHATDVLNYNYEYNVIAKLVVTDRNDKTKILYNKNFELIRNKKLELKNKDFVISEIVTIDYDKYNDYVNSFKQTYALNVDSNLEVVMNINAKGTSDIIKSPISLNNQLKVSIPLSEQTIDITIDSKDVQKNGLALSENKLGTNDVAVLIAGIILCLISVVALVISVYKLLIKNNRKDIYNITINKYLKEYDRMIVTTAKITLDERNYQHIIRVADFEELIDIRDTIKEPILYYEVIPNEKSYFVISNGDKLYKLTITRAWLERKYGKNNK